MKIRHLAVALVLVFIYSTFAHAQQATPSQTAGQINTVIIQWAQTIEALQRENADLKKQLEDAKAAAAAKDK